MEREGVRELKPCLLRLLTLFFRLGRVEQILSSTGSSKGRFGESMELVIALGDWWVLLPFARGLSWWTPWASLVRRIGGLPQPKASEEHKNQR